MALPEEDQQTEQIDQWESLSGGVQREIDQTQKELKEIALMLEQSQVEVDKLAQRNAAITMHLQQVQSKIEELPAVEIRNSYDAALDAQQRLIVMRSQLEKLQSEQGHLDRYLKMLRNVQQAMAGGQGENGSAGSQKLATAEMMIQAQESERQRLSRQIHDGPAQTLSNFILQTEIAMRLFDVDPNKAREELSNLKMAASTAFQQVRDFIFDLRPMMLDDLGLVPTIKRYTEAFREKSSIDVDVSLTGSERRFESYLEVMIFRSMQELLNNASSHSQATQIKVQLDIGPESVRLVVEDNGRGFDPDTDTQDSGLGIQLIKDRAEMLGGVFEVESVIGEGARITLTLPVASA
jgi:two-component system sensor histidine kinase DegS